ncbi:MAG: hypothetical protein KAY37_10070 [Phycisphaerae bacterium]|nr:hypothetical protein [Phycisphaerae bacterium]
MKLLTSVLWLSIVTIAFAGPAFADSDPPRASYDGHIVARFNIQTEAELQVLQSISPDIWSDYYGLGPVDARIPPELIPALEEAGLSYRVIIDDLGPLVRAQYEPGEARDTWDHYMDHDEILTYINDLAALRPDLCDIFSIGQSIEGRDLWVLHITGPGDNKPAVYYESLIHCREWITAPIVLYLADYLVTGYDTDPYVQSLVDGLDFYLLPITNPDGYVYTWGPNRMWRKNRRNNGDGSYGVDLNRNWAYGWGGGGSSGNPSSDIYRGTAPFSEPETTAVSNFVSADPNIVAFMDYHSYSQLILWPFGNECVGGPPEPDGTMYWNMGNDMQSLIQAVHGMYYEPGPICETIYQASGGSVDWAYADAGCFAFTIELRDTGQYGFLLPPEQILPTCEENLPALLHLTDWALTQIKTEISFPNGLPELLAPGTPQVIDVQIDAIGESVVPGSPTLHYRYDGGAFQTTPLTPVGGNLYQATLPAAYCDDNPEYYFSVAGTTSGVNYEPAGAPAETFTAAVGEVVTFFADNFDANPGWSTQGQWAFGQPTGGGGSHGGPDPTSGHTGLYVYGYNLNGDYSNNMNEYHLTSTPLDCSGIVGVKLSFWRWLGVEQPGYDHAYVRVSNNGSTWHTVWENTAEVTDYAWTFQEFDISDYADDRPTVYLRWTMGSTDWGWTYCGWNIDDVALTAFECTAPPICRGDSNCDDGINWRDVDFFVAAMNDNVSAWETMFLPGSPTCPYENNDVNDDGTVNWRDIDPLVTLMNTTCP